MIKKTREMIMEFKRTILTSIATAIGFLTAYIWREPIINLGDVLLAKVGLVGEMLYIQFISATFLTIFMAILLIIITKWGVKEK